MEEEVKVCKGFQEAGLRRSELDAGSIESLTKQVAKGGGIAFAGSIIQKIATFGLHILLARVLGSASYGLYALGFSVTSIAQTVASLGLNQGIVRFCAMYRGKWDNPRIKGTFLPAIAISSLSSVLVATGLFAFSSLIAQRFFNKPELTGVLRIFALAIPFYTLTGIATSLTQSFKRIEYQTGVHQVFRPLVNIVLVVLAFLLGFRLAGAVYGFLACGALSLVLALYFACKVFPDIVSPLRPVFETKRLIRFSVPMFLAGFCYLTLIQTDRIMLGFFKESSEVGVYNAASIISRQLLLFFYPLVAIFLPMISDLYNKQQLQELERLLKTVSRWMLATSLPFGLIICIFSPLIMNLFGTEFGAGWPVLLVLTFSQILFLSVGPEGEVLQMSGKQDLVLINTLVMVFVNIGLNIWLIPIWGKLGAAIATALSLSGIAIVQLIQVVRILNIHPLSIHYIKPLSSAVAAAVFGLGIRSFVGVSAISLIMATIAIFVVYALGVLILGLNRDDKLILRAVMKKLG